MLEHAYDDRTQPAASTPTLDRLAREDGVSFRHAFCQSTVCTPSRCSFMTGWYPHVRGHRSMYYMLQPDEPLLLRTLRRHGYFVWWAGRNDLIPAARDGWSAACDRRYEIPSDPPLAPSLHEATDWRAPRDGAGYYSFFAGRLPTDARTGCYYDGDWANVQGAVKFIRSAPKERPFCLYLALGYPHPPYGVEEPFFSRIDRARLPARIPAPAEWKGKSAMLKGIWRNQRLQTWREAQWAELRATYYGMCARVDHQFGMLLEALREFKYVRRLEADDELYDLRADPRELHNCARDPAYRAMVAAFKDRLLTFFLATGDVVPHHWDQRLY